MNDQMSVFDEKKMTIIDVAESLSVTTRTITRYVAKLFPGKLSHGSTTFLDEKQVTAIKLDLEKNKHLDTSVTLPKTDLEKKLLIKQAMSFLNEEIEELKGKIEQAKPAIEFHKQVGDSSGLHTIAEVAKMLGTGRNRLFGKLRAEGILRDNNEPYQDFINRGYFEVKESTNNEHVNSQTFVTAKGLQWLQGRN